MTTLAELQQQFQQHLLTGDTAIVDAIVTSNAIPSSVRLHIYRNAYQSRLEECLANTFSCLKSYLGDDAFYELTLAYAEKYPSNYRSIRWFGDKLAEFIADYYEPDFHFLAELAHFEWSMTQSFDAKDVAAVTINDMIAIAPTQWADMTFAVQPSLQRIDFLWDAVTLWEALHNEGNVQTPKHYAEPAPWVLWRQHYMNRFYALEPDEAWALDAILKGVTFGNLCEGLCQWHNTETVSTRAASLLKSWVESGMISKITTMEQKNDE